MWHNKSRSWVPNTGLGCGYIVRVGLLLMALLVINSLLVMILLQSSEILASDLRIKQTLQFVLPVGLIFVEFWMFDLLRQVSRQE